MLEIHVHAVLQKMPLQRVIMFVKNKCFMSYGSIIIVIVIQSFLLGLDTDTDWLTECVYYDIWQTADEITMHV